MLSPGSRLGPYEILSPLGAGGMGEVYRARDTRLGCEVAIKVLPASFSAGPDRLRRFEQEAKAAGLLNHPNITAVYDMGTHDGAPYVVQELLEGETLRTELSGGRLPARRAVDYGVQIAHGLAAAHERGIVHRDPPLPIFSHPGWYKNPRSRQGAAIEDGVRNAILRLPYYGVFDLISFQVEGTKVTLGGYVYRAVLKDEAEKTVKKVPGVTQVANRIEILPVSIEDDRIRWAAFRVIYTDAFLSKYGTPVGGAFAGRSIWGSRFGSWPGFRTGPWGGAPFFGMEPIGNYAIHIIVKNGVVTLCGVVSNEVDRTKAELDVRQVFGVHGVTNQIQVVSER